MEYMDAQYESIRSVMDSRGTTGGQNKRIPVTLVSKDRAEHLDKVEERIHNVQIALYFVIGILSFIAGMRIF